MTPEDQLQALVNGRSAQVNSYNEIFNDRRSRSDVSDKRLVEKRVVTESSNTVEVEEAWWLKVNYSEE